MKPLFVVLALAAATVATPLTDTADVTIQEWEVPWADTRPRDPYVGPDYRVWFVGQRGHYVAHLEPGSGEFERFALEDGTGPHNLIVADNGDVWYAGNRAAHIGKLDPKTGEITKVPMPNPEARDPHTLIFDGRGNIWFTVQGGNFVGKLDTATAKVDLIAVPTPRARPYGIVVDDSGRPWIAQFGTYKISTVDLGTMQLREYDLPDTNSRPRRIALTSDGMVWYVDYALGRLGRLDPASGGVSEWPMPGGSESRPYAMAVDERDRLWFVETGLDPNRFVGFDPATEEFFGIAEVPSGGGTVRHMVYHAPKKEIWFGADTNTIGRATIP